MTVGTALLACLTSYNVYVRHEHEPRSEISLEVAKAYAQVFIPRSDLYPLQLPGGHWVSVHKPLSQELVHAHLKGVVTLGAYALDAESRARWLCFDADGDNQWDSLCELAADLQTQHVPLYLELSRRGGHLWLFTDPLPGQAARRFARQLITGRGLEDIEIYPKQDQLKDGPGSFVRLPLGIHQKTRRRYHFISLSGEPLAATIREQVAILSNPQRVPQAFISEVLQNSPQIEPRSSTPRHRPPGKVTGHTPSERIKNSIRVYDFISRYVALDEHGKGHCPFHDDEHASFQVNVEHNYWHCYAGCGGGSLIDFWMRWREKQGQSGDFKNTITELAQMLL